MKKYKYSYKKHDFNILKNGQGDLMLLLRSFEGDIENPKLNYDGKLTATLHYCPNNLVTLFLDGVPLSICQDLMQSKKILIYETNKDKITRKYWATVNGMTIPITHS